MLSVYRKYQHILWRFSSYDELREYELHTVTHEFYSAPFLALRVLQKIASKNSDDFDRVCNTLMWQTYVDDIFHGADTVVEVQSELVKVLKKFGFEL